MILLFEIWFQLKRLNVRLASTKMKTSTFNLKHFPAFHELAHAVLLKYNNHEGEPFHPYLFIGKEVFSLKQFNDWLIISANVIEDQKAYFWNSIKIKIILSCIKPFFLHKKNSPWWLLIRNNNLNVIYLRKGTDWK